MKRRMEEATYCLSFVVVAERKGEALRDVFYSGDRRTVFFLNGYFFKF